MAHVFWERDSLAAICSVLYGCKLRTCSVQATRVEIGVFQRRFLVLGGLCSQWAGPFLCGSEGNGLAIPEAL